MKQLGKDILFSVFFGMAVPAMVLQFGVSVWNRAVEETVAAMETEAVEEAARRVFLPVRVRSDDGTVSEQDMDPYLTGVVLAEMPASFEEEALKAQAVVARTYARKAWVTGGKHGDGSVCTEPACCQAWTSEEGFPEEELNRVRKAVASTSGQVLTYEGELIEATYFSCSGGSTEEASAVWGGDFPYLQAVESPGEEKAAHYRDTVIFTPEEVESALGVTLMGLPHTWVRAVSWTEGGGVDTISIGGKYFTGTEVRSLLGLSSTAFSVSAGQDAITITTKGYGHRVGMSQYGADAMAVMGSSYEEILAHYYPGTVLTALTEGT